jgi:hypothetical protein
LSSWRTAHVAGLFLVLCARPVFGQDGDKGLWFVRAGATPAYIVSDNPFLAHADRLDDAAHAAPDFTIEIGRHTDGTERWHELYGMPSIGAGVSVVSLRGGAAASRPIEAYTFFSWPFARLNDRLTVTTDFGMGLSWGWKTLNATTGAYEDVLGSSITARIDWGFYLRYRATSKISWYSGVDFTHRSNGGTVQPNLGINAIGPKLAMQYNFGSDPLVHHVMDVPPFQPAWEFVIGGAGGIKNVVEQSSPMVRADFGALNVTTALQWHFYRFGKLAAGADATYDGSTGVRVDGADDTWRAAPGQRWSLGLYGGYEHVIGRFSALVQAGSVVARGFTTTDDRRLYSRFGWRYYINNRVWTTFAIRAYGFRDANALEIGAGYRFRRTAD